MLISYKYRALFVLTFTSFFSVLAGPTGMSAAQTPHYAKNFEITEFATHRIATVRFGENDSKTVYQYALVPKDTPLPELPDNIPIIRTPVERIVVLETIHIGFLDALDHLDEIVGAGTTDYISNATVRECIKNGSIQKIQTAQTPNIERLLLLQPDLIFTSVPSNPALDIPTQLTRAGLPAVVTAEYKEQHPLARAEWIEFIAAFFDASEEAATFFNTVAERYKSLCRKVEAVEDRPTVFCGAPYSGIWHVPRGESYIAQTIRDAGGGYLWRDVPGSGVIPLDTERVFLKAAKADIWLNPSFYRSRNALYGTDARFSKFHAALTGQIFNNTKQQATGTGNPIWETGIVRPDDVLADLIKIFHPQKMPDWEFVYYEKLK